MSTKIKSLNTSVCGEIRAVNLPVVGGVEIDKSCSATPPTIASSNRGNNAGNGNNAIARPKFSRSNSKHNLSKIVPHSPSAKDRVIDVRKLSGKNYRSSVKHGSTTKQDEPDAVVDGDISHVDEITFINVPSEIEKLTENRETNRINADDILKNSQENQVKNVYEIILHAAKIAKIEKLEQFTSCRVLDLSCNYIDKLEKLDQLRDLRELKTYDNKIKYLENLDSLKQLCNLQLQHNLIKTIGKGLANLRNLRQLRLDYNNILKLEPADFACCSLITYLNVSHNRLDNLNAVNSLPNLEELHATDNRLRIVTDLKRCRKLVEVNLSRNKIADISGLKDLPKLTVLDVSYNQLFNTKSLGKTKSLLELNISHNLLSELTVLVHTCPNLEIVHINDNNLHNIEDMVVLDKLTQLVELYVNGNPVLNRHDQKPYHDHLHQLLPNLDILDGAHVKRVTNKSAPLMRPMSASTVVSSRQVESQIKNLECELSAFETDLSKRFESVRSTIDELPAQSPSDKKQDVRPLSSSRPTSRCSMRSRLSVAMEFADNQEDY